MIKESLSQAGLAPFAVIGLVAFFSVFVGIALWVFNRGRREVAVWSSLPLHDGPEPVQPRLDIVSHDEAKGCGKCETCTCANDAAEPVVISN